MRLILLGPPGVGKGTQGARLSQALSVPSVSTGALLRALIATGNETPRVLEARQILSGAFVSDTFANQLAFEAIRTQRGFVLDGYPRSVSQAEALDAFLLERGTALDAVFLLRISDLALAARVAGRRVCSECGATYHLAIAPSCQEGRCDLCGAGLTLRPEEDQPGKRLLRRQLYEAQTVPLCAFYQERGLLREIDAEGLPEVVYNKICESLFGLI
ncbi:adenylate kinase family protein [Armatimonas sp.]|uniref:adenylate kinase family protein n=1 Tax=Armatimonas sp. TaxID=1872638 RepID=UPI0037522D0C